MLLEEKLNHELTDEKQYTLVSRCESGDETVTEQLEKKELIDKIIREIKNYTCADSPDFNHYIKLLDSENVDGNHLHFSYSTEYAEEEEVEGEGKSFVVAVELLRPSKFGGSTWSYRWCIFE